MITTVALIAAASLWTVTDRSDAFSDQKYVTLQTEQNENLLVLKCVPGEQPWSLTLVTPLYIGGSPIIRTAVRRVDAQTPSTMSFATKDYLAEAMGGKSAVSDALSAKSRIAIRVDQSRAKGGQIEVLFDASGLASKSIEFRKKCLALGIPAITG